MAAKVIRIDSEEVAWETLRLAIDRQLDFENTELSFEGADWAKFKVNYKGDKFFQSLTPSTMRGFIDFQNDLYHAIGLIVSGDPRISLFKDEQKAKYELTFKVDKGSSDVETEGKGALVQIGKEAVKKMSGRQLVIVLLTAALLFFGEKGVSHYLDTTVEGKKLEAEQERDKALIDLTKQISKDDQEKMKILNDAVKASPRARDVSEYSDHATDSIVRNSSDAREITIQGKRLDHDVISSITRGTRRSAETKIVSGRYFVRTVDTTDEDFFKVRLENEEDENDVIIASLEDAVAFERYKGVIQRAEWGRRPIRVKLSAKMIGDRVVDAKILSASTPKKK